MSRQYLMDTLVDPPAADLAAFTTLTTETLLWNPALFSPIPAYDMRAGKVYKLTASGVITLPAATGSFTINPRAGLVIGSNSMGTSGPMTSPGATAAKVWLLEFFMTARSIAAAGGVASVVNGWGRFSTVGNSGGVPFMIHFGGTNANVDAGVASGIGITGAWTTTAGSITPQFVSLQSLN